MNPTRSALLIIDPQNDFLSEGGAFSRRHVETGPLAAAIGWAVAAARQQGRVVAWVTSVYGETRGREGEALAGQTHTGAPCCVRGSWGAEIIDALRPLSAEASDWHAEKSWYSALRDTGLHERLREAGVERLILSGVATNVCVLATAREARALGYEVEVLADATAAGTASRHAAALREIEQLGGRSRGWSELLPEGDQPVALRGLGAGDTTLWCGALRSCIDETTYEALEREIAWSTMFHRGGEVPRRVAIQGTRGPDLVEPLYRHPVDGQPALHDWTPIVDRIRRATEERAGHPLNHGLLQLYRHGRDWISEHSDKTLDLARPSFIVNVSLGRTRTMVLRPKQASEGAPRASQKIPLPHGSMLLMGLETNRTLYHAIKQEGASDHDGPRISLTFRHIGTHLDPTTGAVWGVGAPISGRDEAERRARARAALDPAERGRQERDEAERMIRLFREENIDPGFEVSRYRPGFEAIDLRTLNEAPAAHAAPDAAGEAP
jgi:nicotinamidase-related amidase